MNKVLADINSITFDNDDKDLFLLDDLRLKADALKHSVLPRLNLMVNHASSKINSIYGVQVITDSHITKSPNFRSKRKEKFDVDYNYCFCGLEGSRIKNKWFGLKRKDNKEAQIVPFKYAFELDENGLRAVLWMHKMKLTDESYFKYLDFLENQFDIISNFCFYSNFSMKLPSMLLRTKENIAWMKENKYYNHQFTTPYLDFPISSKSVKYLIEDYAIFFYLYDCYIKIAEGKKTDEVLLGKLYDWSMSYEHEEKRQDRSIDLDKVKKVASRKIKVIPSLRWQVLVRDGWKCVSCGKTSHDGGKLQLDHILPRSLGGADTIDNLQTLCWECNIGKSNRDDTDLRNQEN